MDVKIAFIHDSGFNLRHVRLRVVQGAVRVVRVFSPGLILHCTRE